MSDLWPSHFVIWTNTFVKLRQIHFELRQIHLAIWTNTFTNCESPCVATNVRRHLNFSCARPVEVFQAGGHLARNNYLNWYIWRSPSRMPWGKYNDLNLNLNLKYEEDQAGGHLENVCEAKIYFIWRRTFTWPTILCLRLTSIFTTFNWTRETYISSWKADDLSSVGFITKHSINNN